MTHRPSLLTDILILVFIVALLAGSAMYVDHVQTQSYKAMGEGVR